MALNISIGNLLALRDRIMRSPAAGGRAWAEICRALPPRVRVIAAAFVAIVITHAAWVAFNVGGERLTVVVDDAGLLGVATAATIVTGLRSVTEVDPRLRRGWLFLSVSCAAWTVGQVIQTRG